MKKIKFSLFFILITQLTLSQSSILTDMEIKEKRSTGETILIIVIFLIATYIFISKSNDKK